ncbi:MAG TPA: crosslink repair DNA glycosylase YcaQ family protein [Actinomycetota bacterium]|nr:crosslink repair DNA glycosylase YcaQ family protein [Actinomycetota bacterium]
MGGLQAQYAPSSDKGLWSRVSGMKREELDRAWTAGSRSGWVHRPG